MAKKQKKKREKLLKPQKSGITESFFSLHPVWITLGLVFVLLLIFYHQLIFQGLTFQGSDSLNSKSAAKIEDDALSRGIFPKWCPYIFSGMPFYASLMRAPRVNPIDYTIRKGLEAIFKSTPDPNFLRVFINYLLLGGLMYLMLRGRKLSKEACMFAAVAVVFLPQFIAFTAYGHNTKFLAVVLIPLIFYLTERMFTKPSASAFALTALAIGFQLMRAHIQVTYYTFLLLGIYFIFKAVLDLKDKKGLKPVLTKGGMLAASIAAGFMLASVLYFSVYEYQHFSIRGGGSTGGLGFDYASSWSFHPIESITFLIPSFMGFGGNTYWGKMPFTDYPLYMGIVVLLLAGVAFILKRDRFTWFLGIVAIFSLVVSFGRHFGILYKPMYNWLPFFNKFRVPSMIHILLDISIVALAAVGLNAIINFKEKSDKLALQQKKLMRYFYIFLAVVGLFLFFLVMAKGTFFNLIANSSAGINEALRTKAYNMAASDALKAVVLVGLSITAVYLFLKGQLSKGLFTFTLIAIVVVDLWWVDFKIIKPSVPGNEKAYFAKTEIVQKLGTDPSLYRLYPLYDDKQGNWYMYHLIQSVTGYHAAKLRIYQEFIKETGLDNFEPVQRAGTASEWLNVRLPQWPRLPHFLAKYWSIKMQNQRATWAPIPLEMIAPELLSFHHNILDMLNVKYITTHQQIPDTRYHLISDGKPLLYENTSVMPRAFFVDSVEVLTGKKRIFSRMKDATFDPRYSAIIEDQPEFKIDPADSNTVQITNWDMHDITLEADAAKPALLVLSEIYYPAGWKASVDGVETKIYKTNYILRSLFLKPGHHSIKFTFAPKSFIIGMWTSIGTLVILLGLVAINVIYRKRMSK